MRKQAVRRRPFGEIPAALVAEIRVLSHCEDVRPIPGCWGYFATANGEVWSVHGMGMALFAKTPRRMKTYIVDGSTMLQLGYDDGIQRPLTIQRALALAFHGEPPHPDAVAIFKDGNYNNVVPENIEWVSRPECSITVKARHGTILLTAAQVKQIRQMLSAGEKRRDIADHYGVSVRTIDDIAIGVTWTAVTMKTTTADNRARGDAAGKGAQVNDRKDAPR